MNKPYAQMSRAELTAELSEQEALYGASKEKHYQLDMSRGKPSNEQLDLTVGLNNVLSKTNDFTCRGGIAGRHSGNQGNVCRYIGSPHRQYHRVRQLFSEYHV